VLLLDATPAAVSLRAYEVGKPGTALSLDAVMEEMLLLTAERNPDFYEMEGGNLRSAT
jgi:hypothetical protein